MKHFLFALILLLALVVIAPVVMATGTPPPPALPGLPDQAPVGGLGLLAAAGGLYAWKKLRSGSDN